LAALFLLCSGCAGPGLRIGESSTAPPCFVALTNFARFQRSAHESAGQIVLTSPPLRTPFAWDDLVVSWNARAPRGSGLKIDVRAFPPGRPTAFYTLGYWAEDTADRPRESVREQKDEDGDVETDTLVLRRPAEGLQLRLTLSGTATGEFPEVRFLGLSFVRRGLGVPAGETPATTAPRTLPVPERSQRSYPGGQDWCSPTSVSMVLAYWAEVLHRPDLNIDVPDVAAGVYDPVWPGTGNWPFNTAFAAARPGMRAYVTRLANVSDLRELVAAGVPPILSVSFGLLHGKPEDAGSGHLVVCAGFAANGDMVVNDPWARPDQGDPVRRVVPLKRALPAWAYSQNTVYLIYPEDWRLPPSRPGKSTH
jgi:hypothetical protein